MRRCFVVGSPRSGTTLVQALLASHPNVWSLPETHFFRRVEVYRRGPRGLLVEPGADALLREISSSVGVRHPFRPRWLTIGRCIRRFATILDTAAAAEGARVWVEKTPGHLNYIPLIARFLPDARYVHVTRQGADVVASVVQVTREHPGWDGARSIDEAAERWRADIAATRQYDGTPGHSIVCYEELAADPVSVLRPVWELLEVEEISPDHRAGIAALISDREPWKQSLLGPIARSSRLADFNPEERALIVTLTGGPGEVRLPSPAA